MAMAASACTLGTIADAMSGAPLSGATVTFRHMDTSTTEGFSAVPVAFTSSIQSVTSGAVVPSTSFNYWLDPYAAENPGDPTVTFVPAGWVRATVGAAGHATRRIYRNHQYSPDLVQTDVPYSAGPYPIPGSWDTQNGLSSIEDFNLYPTSAHPLWPDLIVDVRSLAAYQVGIQFPGLLCPTSKCLVFGLNIANVSDGPFELRSNTGSPGTITQVVTQSTGSVTNFAISGGMMIKPPDEGWHVADLVRIRLRGPIVSGVCDTEPTASSCSTVLSSAKKVCLMGTAGAFDPVYGGTAAQQAQLTCWPNGNPGSPSGTLHTGLAPGFAEFYSIGNEENVLDVSGVASGTYWLEAEVNPNGTYLEDTSNNIARVRVTL
jgi:hypothetical protein